MRFPSSVLALSLAIVASSAFASGSSPIDPPKSESAPQQAAQLYNEGLKHRDKAWRLEDEADKAPTDQRRAELEGDARKAYKAAINSLRRAVEKKP